MIVLWILIIVLFCWLPVRLLVRYHRKGGDKPKALETTGIIFSVGGMVGFLFWLLYTGLFF